MRRGERGVLLIDAMVALALFGVILGTWLLITTAKCRILGETDRHFRATLAAESALAEVREGILKPGAFPVPGGFGAQGEVRTKPDASGLVELSVVVTWREPAGGPESVIITTLARP